MSSNFLYAISAINVAVSIIIALAIFVYNHKSRLHIWISTVVLIGSLWAGTLTLASYLDNQFLGRLLFSFGALSTPAFATFILVFYQKQISRKKVATIFAFPLIIAALCPWQGMLFDSETFINGSLVTGKFGPLMPFFQLSYYLFTVIMIVQMVKAGRVLTGVEKSQLRYIITGIGTSMVLATILTMILPTLGNYEYGKYGAFTIIFYTVPMIYVATKHHLNETKVVVSEVWALALIGAVLVSLLVNQNLFSLILFILATGLGLLLVRSVISESEKSKMLKRQNDELLSDKAKLATLDKMKDEFIQMATHELNTPLAIIEGKLSMIVEEKIGTFDDQQRAELKPIYDAAQRLAKLLKNLFEIAEIQQKMIWLFKRETDISALVEEVAIRYQGKAQSKGLKIVVEKGSNVPKIATDKEKISEVVARLVDNGIKFTSYGQVTISTSATGDLVQIKVADTGMGIVGGDLIHIFDKFYQPGRFSGGAPIEQQGVGSGLYLSKCIVELHGGQITAESEPHHGSAFTVSLPIHPTDEGSFQNSNEPLPAVRGEASKRVSPPAGRAGR